MVKGQNISVDLRRINIPCTAAIAAISFELGIVLNTPYLKSVNTDKFMLWLDLLRHEMKRQPFCLYLDNLSVHKTIRVREYCATHSIELLWAPVYSP